MAVEKMKMMNIVALKEDVHNILRELVLDGSVHITNASNSSNFTIKYLETQRKNFMNMGVDVSKIIPYHTEKVFKKKKYKELLDKMFNFFSLKEEDIILDELKFLNFSEKLKLLDDITQKADKIKTLEDENRNKRSKIKILLNAIEYFKDSDINLKEFKNLNNIEFDIGQITKNSWIKLKSNYENLKAIVVHLGSNNYGETILIFTPKVLESETKYLLKSFAFDRVKLDDYDMTFRELIKFKTNELLELEKEQDKIKKQKLEFKEKYFTDVLALYYRYKIIEKIQELENHCAQSKKFMLFSAFVPQSKLKNLKNVIEKTSESAIVSFSSDTDISKSLKIPTKLKNNFILRPFEALVKMYSIPDYKEMDPTPFLAITYMLLFGMMFGDVGQGLVFIIAGVLLSKKIGDVSKIITRIGFSSVIFGFLYGSVFGMENILNAILLRPMEDINTILILAILIGIVLILISYFIGFYNLKKRKDMGNLFFDKNGISGFLFYISFLLIIFNLIFLKSHLTKNQSSILTIISVAIMIVTSTLMFFKPKLNEKFKEKDSLEKCEKFSPVESGFEMFEMIMGFFSNTLSFIRVGAFAINHVGLFMAFHALGQMIGNSFGSFLMILLGNIVILGLEGLIVFIQAIRLEYYELFSKYFKGEGIEYKPISVEIKRK